MRCESARPKSSVWGSGRIWDELRAACWIQPCHVLPLVLPWAASWISWYFSLNFAMTSGNPTCALYGKMLLESFGKVQHGSSMYHPNLFFVLRWFEPVQWASAQGQLRAFKRTPLKVETKTQERQKNHEPVAWNKLIPAILQSKCGNEVH